MFSLRFAKKQHILVHVSLNQGGEGSQKPRQISLLRRHIEDMEPYFFSSPGNQAILKYFCIQLQARGSLPRNNYTLPL